MWRIGTHRDSRHLARHATDVFNLSPRTPRAERVRAASEQTFSIGKQHLDIIATILHALPFVLAGIGLVFGRWPRGVFEGRQRR